MTPTPAAAFCEVGDQIQEIDEELFFASAALFVRDVKARLTKSDPPGSSIVIDAEDVSDIDATAIEQLEELVGVLPEAEIQLAFARVRKPVVDMFSRSGMLERSARIESP